MLTTVLCLGIYIERKKLIGGTFFKPHARVDLRRTSADYGPRRPVNKGYGPDGGWGSEAHGWSVGNWGVGRIPIILVFGFVRGGGNKGISSTRE